MTKFVVYTDGASSPKKKHHVGGWAFALMLEDNEEYIITRSGYEYNTTNNRMEMLAVIEALNFISSKEFRGSQCISLKIISDSQYCVKGSSEWIHGWRRCNWKGGTLKNLDLWKQIDQHLKDKLLNIEFEWVRGHDGNKYNEVVDELCVEAKHKAINML